MILQIDVRLPLLRLEAAGLGKDQRKLSASLTLRELQWSSKKPEGETSPSQPDKLHGATLSTAAIEVREQVLKLDHELISSRPH